MRRILLSTPLKGGLSSFWVKNIIQTCRAKIPGVELEFAFLEGAPVQQARNEIVANARAGDFGELIMLDKDLDASADDVVRLISHEHAKVVCGLYPHRALDTHWHVQAWSADEQPDAAGLMRVKQSAIGFSKIRLSVFDQLEKDNPDRLGLLTTPGGPGILVHEFFAMELRGPNTPEARLNKITELLSADRQWASADELGTAIAEEIVKRHPTANLHTAEDYGFCAMCRASNIPIHVDTKLIVQHEHGVKLPIPTEQLLRMIREGWRQDDPVLASANGARN